MFCNKQVSTYLTSKILNFNLKVSKKLDDEESEFVIGLNENDKDDYINLTHHVKYKNNNLFINLYNIVPELFKQCENEFLNRNITRHIQIFCDLANLTYDDLNIYFVYLLEYLDYNDIDKYLDENKETLKKKLPSSLFKNCMTSFIFIDSSNKKFNNITFKSQIINFEVRFENINSNRININSICKPNNAQKLYNYDIVLKQCDIKNINAMFAPVKIKFNN